MRSAQETVNYLSALRVNNQIELFNACYGLCSLNAEGEAAVHTA